MLGFLCSWMRFLSRNSLLGPLVCLEKVVNEPRNKVTKDSNSQCWVFEEDSDLSCDVIYYLPNKNYHSLIYSKFIIHSKELSLWGVEGKRANPLHGLGFAEK